MRSMTLTIPKNEDKGPKLASKRPNGRPAFIKSVFKYISTITF